MVRAVQAGTSAAEAGAIYGLDVLVLQAPFSATAFSQAAQKVLRFSRWASLIAWRWDSDPWWGARRPGQRLFRFGTCSPLAWPSGPREGHRAATIGRHLAVSLSATVAGSLLGFTLTLLPSTARARNQSLALRPTHPKLRPSACSTWWGAEMTALVSSGGRRRHAARIPGAGGIHPGLDSCWPIAATGPRRLERARDRLGRVHYRVEEMQAACVCATTARARLGPVPAEPGGRRATVVAVRRPAPNGRRRCRALLFQELGARFRAGRQHAPNPSRRAQGSLTGAQSFFDVFRQKVGGDTLLLRGRDGVRFEQPVVHTALPQKFTAGVRRTIGTIDSLGAGAGERVSGRAPACAELWLSRDVRRGLRIRAVKIPGSAPTNHGRRAALAAGRSEFLARPGDNAYSPPSCTSCAAREEVRTPLLRV